MKSMPAALVGVWRISWMELWSQPFVDLAGPGRIRLEADGQGEMTFIAVRAWLDCEPRDADDVVEFSWEGTDEGDQRSGRGWVRLGEKDGLSGRIWFHMGDASDFRAVRDTTGLTNVTPRKGPRRRPTSG